MALSASLYSTIIWYTIKQHSDCKKGLCCTHFFLFSGCFEVRSHRGCEAEKRQKDNKWSRDTRHIALLTLRALLRRQKWPQKVWEETNCSVTSRLTGFPSRGRGRCGQHCHGCHVWPRRSRALVRVGAVVPEQVRPRARRRRGHDAVGVGAVGGYPVEVLVVVALAHAVRNRRGRCRLGAV